MKPDPFRIGLGFDAHRLGGPPPVKLAGVEVDRSQGLVATSDGDVAAHAVADAMLGAAALGDLGTHFPSEEPEWQGADSMDLLAKVVTMVAEARMGVGNIDLTVIAETVRVAPFRERVRRNLAHALGVELGKVSVKATTTDRMGFTGREEGIAAWAVVLLVEGAQPPVAPTSPTG